MENKEITMQERLEAIKDNPYAQHKAEIHQISMYRGVDVGTACAILRAEKGWEYPNGDKDITAFTSFVSELQRMTDEKSNYVLDYFEGKLD